MAARQKTSRSHFRPQKRRHQQGDNNGASGVEMEDFFRHALTLQPARCTFDMDSPAERAELAAAMWSGAKLLGEGSMTAANGALASMLEVILRKCGAIDEGDDVAANELRTAIRLESLLTQLQRSQSQKQVALITARMSVTAARCQLHGIMWRVMSLISPGLLASETWTIDFMAFARELRPPCEYEELPGVGGSMFDNYTRKVLYKSQVTVENSGFMLHMTNWANFKIPKMLAEPNFDSKELCEECLNLPLPSIACLQGVLCVFRSSLAVHAPTCACVWLREGAITPDLNG